MTDLPGAPACGLVAALAARLARPLPGFLAQRQAAPELSYGRHGASPPQSARPAVVTLVLYEHEGDWCFPLTVRTESLAVHAGQVSLPGGAVEPDESPESAAVREVCEELGVPADEFSLLGKLSPLYLYGTDFAIQPYVAWAERPLAYRPQAEEVSRVLQARVRSLLDSAAWDVELRRRSGIEFRAPYFLCEQHRVWGATAMILAEFRALLADGPAA